MKKQGLYIFLFAVFSCVQGIAQTNTFPSSGNVGIGTTSPSAPLKIGAGTASLHYGSNGVLIKFNSGDRALLELHSPDGANRLVFQSLSGGTYLGSLDQKPLYLQSDGGNVGIGTTNPQAKLAVNGDIFSKKVKVTQSGWPDYVFAPGYRLRPLSEVELFIKLKQHLPDVPSAATVEKEGIDLGDNQAVLLKKIEELTLYIIDLNKEVEGLKKEIKRGQAMK
jgi:hypothetical protein